MTRTQKRKLKARPKVVAVFAPHWAVSLVASAAILIIILASITVTLDQRTRTLHEKLADQAQLLALLESSSAKVVRLTGRAGASVRFVYDPTRNQGALIVISLGDPDDELVYRLWLIGREGQRSAGVFRPAADQATVVPVRANFRRYRTVAISVERKPTGIVQPTLTPILLGTI